MQINSQLLSIVAKKVVTEEKTENLVKIDSSQLVISGNPNASSASIVEELLAENTNATIYSIADEIALKNASGKISVDYNPSTSETSETSEVSNISDIGEKISSDLIVTSSLSVQFTDLSSSEISSIKQVIYNLHNQTSDTEEDDEPKPSFIDEFDDVESMFEWLNEQDSSITAETGITRAQLVALTQNDDWEDANSDFFGAMNRIFDVLDKNGDDVLSVDEIKELIGDEIGESSSAYLAKVETYAAEIQTYYESLSDQGKLEFAIEKTREYLEAAGLTAQLEALERLLGMTDLHNDISVGQIAIADLNPDYTGGAFTMGSYTYLSVAEVYNDEYDIATFASDEDTAEYDLGITLDITILDDDWYVLVDTLVHELTHATAYRYSTIVMYDDEAYGTSPTQAQIDELYELGVLTASEYSWYSANRTTMDFYSDEAIRFRYLASTVCGEYLAYQADADYVDSIGGDVLDGSSHLTTAVNGSNEKDTIISHVQTYYDTNEVCDDGYGNLISVGVEALPDWTWWTYA